MQLNSKKRFLLRQSRLSIPSCAMLYMAVLTLCIYAETPPRFTTNISVRAGKFEKIIKNSKANVSEQNEIDQKEFQTEEKTVIHSDIQKNFDKVIPLPAVEDEAVADVVAVEPETDVVKEDVDISNRADSQPVLTDNQMEDQTDKNWQGWLTNYRNACQKGKDEQKMVLVYFYDTNHDSPYQTFETESLVDEEVEKLLEDYICVRIPVSAKLQPTEGNGVIQLPGTDAEKLLLDELTEETEDKVTVLSENVVQSNGKAIITQTILRNPQPSGGTRYTAMRPSGEKMDAARLLAPGRDMGSVAQLKADTFDLTFPNIQQETMLIRHPAFYEMLNTPGVAIIDYKHKKAEYYGKIVSVFPFLKKQPYTVEQTRVMLTLPPGTVTQRSVIFAVRIHPDNPKSTDGELETRLVEEARSHSQYQAVIRKQGHHNWDRRFQKINAYLPTELWACEVCAESWEGQHLLESAIECVACWRFSEGHWSAVVAEHPYYGYDMKLGTNGIWYATGVFGKWRHPTLAKAGTLSGVTFQQPQKIRP